MSIGTERLDAMIAGRHERSACGRALSLPLVSEYRSGYVKCRHAVDERFINSNGVLFGGYLAALLDDVSGHTTLTVLADDKVCATAELSVSYFRPCLLSDGELLLEGSVVNSSRRFLHIEVTLSRADGKLIAKARAIHAISDRPLAKV